MSIHFDLKIGIFKEIKPDMPEQKQKPLTKADITVYNRRNN
jgi:hypothetical protein